MHCSLFHIVNFYGTLYSPQLYLGYGKPGFILVEVPWHQIKTLKRLMSGWGEEEEAEEKIVSFLGWQIKLSTKYSYKDSCGGRFGSHATP